MRDATRFSLDARTMRVTFTAWLGPLRVEGYFGELHVARERRLLDEHVREAEGRIFRSLEVDAGREQGHEDGRGTRQLHARHRPGPVTAMKARTVATLPGA